MFSNMNEKLPLPPLLLGPPDQYQYDPPYVTSGKPNNGTTTTTLTTTSATNTTPFREIDEVSGMLKYTTSSADSINMNITMGVGMGVSQDGNVVMIGSDGIPCGSLKSSKEGIEGSPGMNNTNTKISATNNSGIFSAGNRHKSKRKCCSCFGSPQSMSTPKTSNAKPTTFWAGLLTNLGICTLLLAYTLLGSFIFLTIENEDSSLLHQQRTLASTKRQSSDSRSLSPQLRRVDNASAFSSASNANDFVISDPQLAILADTYDVRQRTIENIWDITVSLNILYKENWTKLAALEIAKFQDQLIKRLNEDAMTMLSNDIENSSNGNSPATEAVLLLSHENNAHHYEWNFAKAFLYSLTVLTTIGYGNIAPKTTLGRLVTLAYAILGIPLTLVYLSSTGGVLAKVAREVFSRALCCCLCSNCGYCCYDEKRMAEKEKRMKRKRQQEELRAQQSVMQEPYYVRPGSLQNNFHSPEKHSSTAQIPDVDSLSASESRGSMHGLSILAPILLCLSMMIIYIGFGALVLYRLENWPILDGVYFCFMSLSTIGFGDLVPGLKKESTTTTWFCSIYIMSGMALTAMCFNVLHEEIVHRIKIVVEFKKTSTLDADDQSYYMPP